MQEVRRRIASGAHDAYARGFCGHVLTGETQLRAESSYRPQDLRLDTSSGSGVHGGTEGNAQCGGAAGIHAAGADRPAGQEPTGRGAEASAADIARDHQGRSLPWSSKRSQGVGCGTSFESDAANHTGAG